MTLPDQADQVEVFGTKLGRSLEIVMSWQARELRPHRTVTRRQAKLLELIRQQAINFMIVVHQSLITTKLVNKECENAQLTTRLLLGERVHEPESVRTMTKALETALSNLDVHIRDIRDKFRLLRTAFLQMYKNMSEEASEEANEEARSAFLDLLRDRTSLDIVDKLRHILDDLDGIETSLDVVTREWRIYRPHMTLALVCNKIALEKIRQDFVTTEERIARYRTKMGELYEEHFAHLNHKNKEYLATVGDCHDLVLSTDGRLEPKSEPSAK